MWLRYWCVANSLCLGTTLDSIACGFARLSLKGVNKFHKLGDIVLAFSEAFCKVYVYMCMHVHALLVCVGQARLCSHQLVQQLCKCVR